MATKLDKTLKREIDIDGQAYMVAISPEGVKLTQKGYRKGREMTWRGLWNSGMEEGASTSGGGGARGGASEAGGETQPAGGMSSPAAGGMNTQSSGGMDTPTSGGMSG